MRIVRRSSGEDQRVAEPPMTLPAAVSGDVAAGAVRVVARAEAMGLIELTEGRGFDRSTFDAALDALLTVGIGRQTVLLEDVAANPRGAVEALNRIIDDSPHPPTEWPAVVAVLGSDLVIELTGVSASSLSRYSSADRATPDAVAYRLHFLAMVIADLMGSYNHYGVRRWFARARRALGGRSPREALGEDWSPDGESALAVAELARSLTNLGAT